MRRKVRVSTFRGHNNAQKWCTYVLAIRPGLAIDGQVPDQNTLEKLLVLLASVDIKPLVLVRLPLRRDLHDCLVVLSPENKQAGNVRVVRLSEESP